MTLFITEQETVTVHCDYVVSVTVVKVSMFVAELCTICVSEKQQIIESFFNLHVVFMVSMFHHYQKPEGEKTSSSG